MQPEQGDSLYEVILRIAAVPILALLIFFSWVIINYLMNPRWQQERRNRQIRKAVAARQARLARSRPADEPTSPDETKTPSA
ncbi:MAG TPA: hypothetical protein VFA07_08455 [Chthonomonadaceae bacterium]|nr:hypothetical protein [Chthonomonadaceae bacterium]